MSFDVAISVKNVSKSYQIYDKPHDRLKQGLWRGRKQFFREFKALDNVSFEVKKGETVGIIGRNGSGKSTLLQIICGILMPSLGEVEVNGRLSALLELGAGFNPEFTGKENIYMNTSILGLSVAETDAIYDDIVEFSGIGVFVDQPVKTYSSGMYVRLAFSVVVNVSPELLIVDEALAVGDAAFQYKCIKKMEVLRDSGVTIFLVSHDASTIKRFCDRAIWLHSGRVVSDGDSGLVADEYQNYVRGETKEDNQEEAAFNNKCKDENETSSNGGFGKFTGVNLTDGAGNACKQFVYGDDLVVHFSYELKEAIDEELVLGCAIFRNDGLYVCGLNTGLDKISINTRKGCFSIDLVYKKISLVSGEYSLTIGLFDSKGLVASDALHGVGKFSVVSPYIGEGVYISEHEWVLRDE